MFNRWLSESYVIYIIGTKRKHVFFSAAMFDFQGVYIVNLCIVMYVLDTKGSQKVWWVVIWTARGDRMGDWIHQWHSTIYIHVNTYCSNGYRRPVLVLPLLKQKKHASVGGQLEAPHFRGHRHMFPKRCPPYSFCCFICFVVLWVTKERRFLTLALCISMRIMKAPLGQRYEWIGWRLIFEPWPEFKPQAPCGPGINGYNQQWQMRILGDTLTGGWYLI